VTLDDVSCLLHLSIDGMLLAHESISRGDAMEMMMRYLGSSPRDALEEVNDTRGAHAHFSYLRRIFKERLCSSWRLILTVVWRRRCRSYRTRLSAYFCYTWWISRSSQTRAPPMWMLSI